MKKINFQLLMTISMCFFSSVLAQDATNAVNTTVNVTEKECTKELLLSYFPQNFVKETLKKFNVPQDKWDTIAQSLSDRNKDVVKLVEDKAAQQSPNPLKDPSLHQQAVAIFRDTLLQVFSDVAKANGISDDEQIKKMFIDIQQQKAKRFVECRKQAETAAGGTPNAAGASDNKDDENDDSDDDEDDDEDDFDDKEQEKDGADEEDADNSVKFPKPRVPRYPEERNQISQGDRPGQGNNNQWEQNNNNQWQQDNQNNPYQQNNQYHQDQPGDHQQWGNGYYPQQ